ncbi:MAG TPA: ATP-binding protein [Planctomycetota bacterium]|nr:ATP-binding protein [Planctomycetota bacterium]
MSLRLRLLIVIGAVNVGLLLLVVWLGLETAASSAQVSPEALLDAFRISEEADLEAVGRLRTIRYVVRLRPQSDEIEGSWTPDAEAEVHRLADRLRELVDEKQPMFELDADGFTRIDPSPRAAWSACHVAFTEYAREGALEGLRQAYILFGSGTILLIGATFLVLRRLVLRPLEQLSEAARAVAEGKPPPDVPRPRANDEVGNLVDGFNRMAQEVHEYQTRLEERVLDALSRAKAAENRLVVAQRLASTGTLAAGFAHEINNPLGGVLNALRRLREGELAPDRRAEYFDLVFDGLDRIRTIVERMLHFAPRRREPSDVDVADACRRAAGLASHRAERRGITLEVRADRPVTGVVGDAQELTQAILNLVLNAEDAIPEGQAGTVRLEARREGAEAVVEVTDNGVGMDPVTAGQCVDLFFTTKPEGTGLGLAIVQFIVTEHGGTMDIRTEKGKGTTVLMRLPIGG